MHFSSQNMAEKSCSSLRKAHSPITTTTNHVEKILCEPGKKKQPVKNMCVVYIHWYTQSLKCSCNKNVLAAVCLKISKVTGPVQKHSYEKSLHVTLSCDNVKTKNRKMSFRFCQSLALTTVSFL